MSVCLSVCLSGANGSHYQSKDFVCLSVISRACVDNRADVVDWLLIVSVKARTNEISVIGFRQTSMISYRLNLTDMPSLKLYQEYHQRQE